MKHYAGATISGDPIPVRLEVRLEVRLGTSLSGFQNETSRAPVAKTLTKMNQQKSQETEGARSCRRQASGYWIMFKTILSWIQR